MLCHCVLCFVRCVFAKLKNADFQILPDRCMPSRLRRFCIFLCNLPLCYMCPESICTAVITESSDRTNLSQPTAVPQLPNMVTELASSRRRFAVAMATFALVALTFMVGIFELIEHQLGRAISKFDRMASQQRVDGGLVPLRPRQSYGVNYSDYKPNAQMVWETFIVDYDMMDFHGMDEFVMDKVGNKLEWIGAAQWNSWIGASAYDI